MSEECTISGTFLSKIENECPVFPPKNPCPPSSCTQSMGALRKLPRPVWLPLSPLRPCSDLSRTFSYFQCKANPKAGNCLEDFGWKGFKQIILDDFYIKSQATLLASKVP
jgi:hypothetical protein